MAKRQQTGETQEACLQRIRQEQADYFASWIVRSFDEGDPYQIHWEDTIDEKTGLASNAQYRHGINDGTHGSEKSASSYRKPFWRKIHRLVFWK